MNQRLLLAPMLLFLALTLSGVGALLPALVRAQGHALYVTLRDTEGQGLAEVTISVRNEDGQELLRATSNTKGTAEFADLPAVVRVAVAGQARGGPQLYQLGADATGVRLDLGQNGETTTLDLRVERDGLVLPDPATMIARQEGGPLVVAATPIPTALLSTPAALPAPSTATAGVVRVAEAQAPAQPRHDGWVPLVTLLVIALAAGVMLLIQRRTGRGQR
jgi:hypothetical protein